jgi:hypothetical protein
MKTQVWHLQRIVEESDGYIAIAIDLKNIQGGHIFGGGGAHIICDFGGKAFIEIKKPTKNTFDWTQYVTQYQSQPTQYHTGTSYIYTTTSST